MERGPLPGLVYMEPSRLSCDASRDIGACFSLCDDLQEHFGAHPVLTLQAMTIRPRQALMKECHLQI